ncbi:hypothetical protein RAB80_015324 [Fusarium oxysporum f. sp. vasinfectum]|uniref:Uncharacterized protein n=1 Tax=Fusarium oxysporum f. sp. vasinfectum 25433 TaxID=1089449 RepID=X0KVM2_FUSOX|nr:hypothetical protein FOTG_18716 [Fusarium oxysporum f. sp. vasinfectum 25433]KAK2669798.1 hypothetical protein RAB80_015324 [Fusarium oxysporum f. sp. vasinfectum]KAK2925310.1 hypothetical protein FoTM2_015590 [Fusarium oxysporum f. sp. vasinfectum]
MVMRQSKDETNQTQDLGESWSPYKPLSQHRDCTRLLRIEAAKDGDPIICSLFEVIFGDRPKFDAPPSPILDPKPRTLPEEYWAQDHKTGQIFETPDEMERVLDKAYGSDVIHDFPGDETATGKTQATLGSRE